MLKVHDLQQFLESVIQPLRNAGASSKVTEDMSRLANCLAPFRDSTLADFADFLAKAQTCVQTGQWPAPGKKASPAARGGKPTVQEMVQKTMEMYERAAADSSLEYTQIDAFVDTLKPLTVAQLKELAAQVDVLVPGKAKKDNVLREISQAIKNRKGSLGRTSYATP